MNQLDLDIHRLSVFVCFWTILDLLIAWTVFASADYVSNKNKNDEDGQSRADYDWNQCACASQISCTFNRFYFKYEKVNAEKAN